MMKCCFVVSVKFFIPLIALLFMAYSAIATDTYFGTATTNIWYSGLGLGTYQQNITITKDDPLRGETNVEGNPFHLEMIPEVSTLPGAFVIYSATEYFPDNGGPSVVWQYWRYDFNEADVNYSGKFLPEEANRDNFNIIVAEDVTGYTPSCITSIASESVINMTFYTDDTMTATISGGVYDPLISKLCTNYIDRFEILINAQLYASNGDGDSGDDGSGGGDSGGGGGCLINTIVFN